MFRRLPATKGVNIKTKVCGTCKEEKPVEEFRNRTAAKDGKQSVCAICDKIRQSEYYIKNRSHLRPKLHKAKLEKIEKHYAIVNELKKEPCIDCGNTFDPICMDYDHIDNNKFKGVSALVNQGYSLKVIMAEIAKCELVCACCHRIRTRDRFLSSAGDGMANVSDCNPDF